MAKPDYPLNKPDLNRSRYFIDEKSDFGFLQLILKCVGIRMEDEGQGQGFRSYQRNIHVLFSKLVTVFIHLYLLHSIVYVFYDYQYTWIRLMDVLRCLSAIVPFDIFIFRKQKVQKLLICHKEMIIKNGYSYAVIKRKMSLVFVLIMGLTVSMYFLQMSLYCVCDPEMYLNGFIYGTNVTTTGKLGASVLCFFDATIFFIFIWGTCGLSVIYYQTYCFLFTKHLKTIKEDLSGNLFRWGVAKIGHLSTKLLTISNCVAALDEAFSVAVLWWYVETMAFVCVNVHSSLVEGANFSEGSVADTLFYALGMIYILVIFFTISFSASAVIEESENCRTAFGTLIAKACSTSETYTMDNNFLLKVQLLERHFDNAQLQLTGWRFFIITRAFIVSVLAAFFTYTAVLIQLAQGNTRGQDTVNSTDVQG